VTVGGVAVAFGRLFLAAVDPSVELVIGPNLGIVGEWFSAVPKPSPLKSP
jgi:hypothetical protein